MNKQQLASKIWQSANKMRSKIEANEYKDYILGFIFYKFLSDKELKLLKDEGMSAEEVRALAEDDTDAVKFIQIKIGYFIAYKDLFSTWLEKGSDFDVGNVRDALSAFSRHISARHRKVFTGIFDTLQTRLSKLGDTSASQSKAIIDLLQLIKDIPMDGKQDYDVLGFVYEYLISNFAANAGKKAGEFYTPHEVSLLMSEIVANHLKALKSIEIYDPTSGSGSLLINIGRSAAKHIENDNNIKYYAQELKQNTFNLTRMNLVMRDILPDNIAVRNADTLEDDWPYFDEDDPVGTYKPLYVDAVVSNPPYSQAWEPSNKETDPRYSRFGLAPKTKADFAFLLHDLYHVKPDGIMTIVLPHGVLFRGDPDGKDGEGKIRKNLIEQNHIDAIIGLPPNVFFGTGIATIIMVLKQPHGRRDRDDVLFIDASKCFVKVGKNNQLRASDIKKIADAVASRDDILKFSRKVSRDEIRKNGWNLNIPRYVDSSDTPETWDLYSTMFGGIPKSELAELNEVWAAFPNLWVSLFTDNGTPYVSLAVEDVKRAIAENTDVKDYLDRFAAAFGDFGMYLNTQLIGNIKALSIEKEESVISEDIFARLTENLLIDKYKAYQALNDEWVKTVVDLEIIQTEGFGSVKVVDPNMVIKKKGDVEHEVQDGWIGRVIPFDLVQSTLLKAEADALLQKENRLAEIAITIEECLESLTEEDKEDYKEAFNDDGDYIKAAVVVVAKKLRTPGKHAEDSIETKLILASDLFAEETALRKEIKVESAALHMLTKETIENLTDEQALLLLDLKWVKPVVAAMNELPQEIIRGLTTKIMALAKKYIETFDSNANRRKKTEDAIISQITLLTGCEYDRKGLAEIKRSLQQSRSYKLEQVKLSLLAKMFPLKGAIAPEIRFKGFTEAWEMHDLTDSLSPHVGNNTLSRADLNYDNGEVLNIHYGDILIKFGSLVDSAKDEIPYITNGLVVDYRGYLLQDGDIIFADTAEDETAGKVVEITNSFGINIVSGLHTMVYRPKCTFAPYFLGYYLNSTSYRHQLLPLMQGAKVLSLSRSNLAKTQICYPKSLDEQATIGIFFRDLDALIEANKSNR